MVRKLTAALLSVGVFVPGLANALGLGEIKLNSHLSEPLNAEIDLVQTRELTEAEILPGLASPEDFDAAGVQRFHHLTDLQFEVVVNSSGRSYIKVKSRKPIREPFINFLVEVHWPAGRLLREYTLLLDPPNFSLAAPQPVQPAVTTTGAPTTTTVNSQPQVSQPAVTVPSQTQPADVSSAGGKTYGPTGSADSLWSIARALRPADSVSIQQTMIAIQQLNPESFIDGNINLLKKGQILRGPTVEEARQVSSREAIGLVQQQNRAWKERISGGRSSVEPETAQIDTSGRAIDSFEEAVRSDEGRLRLVSADAEAGGGDTGQGGVNEANRGVLRERADLAEEEADKYRLENDDLRGKVTELEEQVDTTGKLLDLKDDQIAALQARLAKMEEEMQRLKQSGDTMVATVGDETATVDDSSEQPEVAVIGDAEPEMVDDAAAESVDYNFQVEEPEDDATEVVQAARESQPAIKVEETPKQVVLEGAEHESAQTPKVAPTLMEQLTQSPLYMAIAGGGVLVLALLALIIGRRRSEQSDELDEALMEDFSLGEDAAPSDMEAASEALGGVEREEAAPQTADVLGEADIYIAYGRFPQAIEMLEKAADAEPQRSDIRMKLLETSFEAKDEDTFRRHYQAVQELAVPADVARADGLKQQFIGGEVESDFGDFAEDTSDTLVADSGFVSATEESDNALDDSLDFDLGEDTLAADEPVFEEAEQESNELEFNLDFDAGVAADLEVPEPETAAKTEEDEDDFSLDFDVDSELAESPAQFTEDEDNGVDLDGEFNLDLTEEASPAGDGEDIVSFGEAEESLDFELAEEAVDAAQDNALEFNLDVDELELDEPVLAEEGEETLIAPPERTVASEDVIDPSAAAALADELDLDADLDLGGDVSGDAAEEGSDELEFSVEADEPQAAETFEEEVEPAITPVAVAPIRSTASSDDELDFLTDADESSTKLDLARAYIDMGDREGAKDILDEVLVEGNEEQQAEAKELLARLD